MSQTYRITMPDGSGETFEEMLDCCAPMQCVQAFTSIIHARGESATGAKVQRIKADNTTKLPD